ncbi:MAG TPA: alkaline phosphatase family protein [Candidatus Acidoferrales bacterium]|nr:alkaline phosphatase family protein [Candidatus Acidoferrales bacterium]
MKPRVFILGLDGADDFSLGAAMRRGLMPTLAGVVENRLLPLRSTPLPITPAAWTAAYTGYNPGKTGVLTFQRRRPNSYGGRIVNSLDVGENGFHTRLASAGKCVIGIGFPMMSPPPKSSALIVSGWDSAPEAPVVNRPELLPTLARFGLRIDDEFETSVSVLSKGIEARFAVMRELLASNDWDCAMLYLGFIDSLGHRLGAGNAATDQLLAKVDQELATAVRSFPENVSFIVCSDHGFGRFTRSFSVMQWLEAQGYLSLRSRSFRNAASIPGVDVMDLETGVIDWTKTRAFCWEAVGRHAAISLNIKGEYPGGIVTPREAFALAGEIIQNLHSTTDPETGERLVVAANRREELFWGPHVGEFPEVFLETADGVTAFVGKRTRVEGGFDLEPGIVHSGSFNSHHDDGIWGSSFHVDDANLGIEDLAPTVYALLGESIPNDCDGVNRSPRQSLAGGAALATANDRGKSVYSAEEEEIVRKRLEDLGYL